MRDRRGACRALVGKPAGKKALGRPRLRWNVILKYIFKNWKGGWIELVWFRIGRGGELLYMQ
jgi:hypothetical protein